MAGETPITVVGNLTADPELRFTPSGAAVANFTVASTPRNFDRQTNEWKDGEALFLNCSVWRQAAENAAESLQRGMRVIVSGRLKARSYETREGEKRTVFEIDVDEVGPSLKYATAKVTKTTRNSGGGGGYGGGGDRWRRPGGGSDDPLGQRRLRRRPGRRLGRPAGNQGGALERRPGGLPRTVGPAPVGVRRSARLATSRRSDPAPRAATSSTVRADPGPMPS